LSVAQTIVNGTVAALTAAARLPNLKRFLNVSSGLVYGPQLWEQEAIAETYLGKVDCASYTAVYPEAKRMAETICAIFRSQSRMPVVNVRPFAFVGAYLPLDRPYAVTNFLRDGINGGPIRIVGDGETVRSYLYGSDAAAWLVTLLTRGNVGSSYNLGSPDGVALKDLAETIARAFPEPRRVVMNLAAPQGKRSRWVPDVRRAAELGVQMRVALPAALDRTLRWHTSDA
jgi:dTDP-glucose 4,6-dehydratase